MVPRMSAPRVLLGNLEPVVRLGMGAVLAEDGIEVIGEETRPQAIVLLAGQLRPDAVVLDLEQVESRELGARVRAAAPDTTVVFWTRDEHTMEVIAPGGDAPRRIADPAPDELRSALVRSQVERIER
jgi:DNA-binding NarL/FixJ family response regulator